MGYCLGVPKVLFSANTVNQLIRKQGDTFTFMLSGLSTFGEPDPALTPLTILVRGVYHENMGYVGLGVSEAAQTWAGGSSMVLCILNDSQPLSVGMRTTHRGRLYTLDHIRPMGAEGKVFDLSLKEVT